MDKSIIFWFFYFELGDKKWGGGVCVLKVLKLYLYFDLLIIIFRIYLVCIVMNVYKFFLIIFRSKKLEIIFVLII